MVKPGKAADDVITASEIACWVYCPEQWRLQYGLGLEPANRKELAAGDRHHAHKAVAERVAGGSIRPVSSNGAENWNRGSQPHPCENLR